MKNADQVQSPRLHNRYARKPQKLSRAHKAAALNQIHVQEMISQARTKLKRLDIQSIKESRDSLRRRGARVLGTRRFKQYVRRDDQLALESARLTALELELTARIGSGETISKRRSAKAQKVFRLIPVVTWANA